MQSCWCEQPPNRPSADGVCRSLNGDHIPNNVDRSKIDGGRTTLNDPSVRQYLAYCDYSTEQNIRLANIAPQSSRADTERRLCERSFPT